MLERFKKSISSAQSVAFGTISMVFFSLVSKFLGFFREMIVAHLFGTSWRFDAVVIATDSTTQMIGIIVGGLSWMMITVYHGIREESPERAKSYVFELISSLLLIMMGIGFLLFMFPEVIVKIFAPGFKGKIFEYAVRKVRYLSVLPIISGAKFLLASLLKAERRFFQYSFAQILFNLVVIPVLLVGSRRFSEASYVLAWILGEFTLSVFYLILSRRYLKPSLKFFDDDVRRTFRLSLPIMFSSSLYAVNRIVDKIFASQLPSGRISALRYAGTLVGVLSSVVIANFLSASYTELSEKVKSGDIDGALMRLKRTVSISIDLAIPFTFWVMLMAEPVIRLVFQHGRFTIESTQLVGSAVIAYSFIIIMNPISSILRQLMYTLEKVKILFLIAGSSVILNALFDWILMKPFGHAGIAASTSIVAFFNMMMLLLFVRRMGFPSFIPWKRFGLIFSIGIMIYLIFLWSVRFMNFTIWMILGNSVFFAFFLYINKNLILRIIGGVKKYIGRG